MLHKFIHNHEDLLQVIGASGGGVGLMLTNIELGLKISIGCVTLGYLLWKWRREYLKIKKEK